MSEKDDDMPPYYLAEPETTRSVPFVHNETPELQGMTMIAELPSCTSAVELGIELPRLFQRHTATLRNLEGRDWIITLDLAT